jgi:hypothetical protein
MQNNEQQKKLDLQKILQAKNVMAGDLFEQVLNSELFPIDKLSCTWKGAARMALFKSAPMTHRLSLKEFAAVVVADPSTQLTLFQFGVLSNALEAVSPESIGFVNEEYYDFIQEALQHIEWYQERVKKIREEIELKVEQEFQMKNAVENTNGEFKGMKPVRGEA